MSVILDEGRLKARAVHMYPGQRSNSVPAWRPLRWLNELSLTLIAGIFLNELFVWLHIGMCILTFQKLVLVETVSSNDANGKKQVGQKKEILHSTFHK